MILLYLFLFSIAVGSIGITIAFDKLLEHKSKEEEDEDSNH